MDKQEPPHSANGPVSPWTIKSPTLSNNGKDHARGNQAKKVLPATLPHHYLKPDDLGDCRGSGNRERGLKGHQNDLLCSVLEAE